MIAAETMTDNSFGGSEILTGLPLKRFRSTKADMEVFRWNLYRIVEEMRPMTVRQVFYQAVVRGYVEKLESEVDRVGANLVLMRKASYDVDVAKKIGDAPAMPLDWIVDLGRRPRAAYTLDGVEDAIRDAAETYRKKLRFFADGAAKKWPPRGSLKGTAAFL